MLPTCISHVCLKTPDLAATEKFYSELLGFPVIFRFSRKGEPYGFYLKVAERQFIEVFEQDPVEPDNGAHCLAHFCFETVDLEALRAKLIEAGYSPDPIKLGVDQSKQFWVVDPNGLNVEVQEYTDRSLQLTGGGTVEVDW